MPSAAEIAADGVWFDAGDGRDLLKELTLRLEAGWRYTAADQEEMLMLRERAVGMKAVRVLERERAEEASKRIAAEQYEFRQRATPTEQRIQELREALADHAEDMRPVRHKQLQLMLDRRAAQDELLLEREEFGHAALNVQRLESALKMKHWETCEKAEQLQQGVAEAEAATEQLEKDNERCRRLLHACRFETESERFVPSFAIARCTGTVPEASSPTSDAVSAA